VLNLNTINFAYWRSQNINLVMLMGNTWVQVYLNPTKYINIVIYSKYIVNILIVNVV